MSFVIAVDFDGTIVKSAYPDIGELIPGSIRTLIYFRGVLKCKLILWTCRTPKAYLLEAKEFCREHGLEFDGLNSNVEDMGDLADPKVFANMYIGDDTVDWVLQSGGGDYTKEKWIDIRRGVTQMVMALKGAKE